MIIKNLCNISILLTLFVVDVHAISCNGQYSAYKELDFKQEVLVKKKYIKPVMREDTFFCKYKAEISGLVNTTYPKFGKKSMVVRVFAINCNICFESQLEKIRTYFPQDKFGLIWAVTAFNIRDYEQFISKYKISKGSIYIPLGKKFTSLDNFRDNYCFILSNHFILESSYILKENIEYLKQYINENFR